jgi:hypothetical protein
MQDNKLPTWCELVPHERHQLLGELVDAMIYSPIAVMNVQSMLKGFKKAGYVKSTILPHLNTQTDGNDLSSY